MTDTTQPEEISQGHRTAPVPTVTSQLYARGIHQPNTGLRTRMSCAACKFIDKYMHGKGPFNTGSRRTLL